MKNVHSTGVSRRNDNEDSRVLSHSDPKTSIASYNERNWFNLVDHGIMLLIEDALYYVPKLIFLESPYFKGLMGDRKLSNTDPIRLNNVTCLEMDSLLQLLTARVLDTKPLVFKKAELMGTFRLSYLWQFDAARSWSLEKIEKNLDGLIGKLGIAIECGAKEFKDATYAKLVKRREPPTGPEVEQLTKILGSQEFSTLISLGERWKEMNSHSNRPQQRSRTK